MSRDKRLVSGQQVGVCPACGETAIHSPHPSGKLKCEACKQCHNSRQADFEEFEESGGWS